MLAVPPHLLQLVVAAAAMVAEGQEEEAEQHRRARLRTTVVMEMGSVFQVPGFVTLTRTARMNQMRVRSYRDVQVRREKESYVQNECSIS